MSLNAENTESWQQFDTDAFYYEDTSKNIKCELIVGGNEEMYFSFSECGRDYGDDNEYNDLTYAIYLTDKSILIYQEEFESKYSVNFMHILETINQTVHFFKTSATKIISRTECATHPIYSHYLHLFDDDK